MEVNGKVAVGVVRNKGKYLVMRRSSSNSSSGKWTFPAGRIEDEESPEEAVKREIKEETGLETSIVRSGDTYIDKGELGHWRLFPFLLETDSREVEMNEEHDHYRWIDLPELESLDTLGETQAPEKLGLK